MNWPLNAVFRPPPSVAFGEGGSVFRPLSFETYFFPGWKILKVFLPACLAEYSALSDLLVISSGVSSASYWPRPTLMDMGISSFRHTTGEPDTTADHTFRHDSRIGKGGIGKDNCELIAAVSGSRINLPD